MRSADVIGLRIINENNFLKCFMKKRIIMNYNYDNEAFEYYLTDKSHVIPFNYLDTIARIYSVKYKYAMNYLK